MPVNYRLLYFGSTRKADFIPLLQSKTLGRTSVKFGKNENFVKISKILCGTFSQYPTRKGRYFFPVNKIC